MPDHYLTPTTIFPSLFYKLSLLGEQRTHRLRTLLLTSLRTTKLVMNFLYPSRLATLPLLKLLHHLGSTIANIYTAIA